jgi:hypothetical protein
MHYRYGSLINQIKQNHDYLKFSQVPTKQSTT